MFLISLTFKPVILSALYTYKQKLIPDVSGILFVSTAVILILFAETVAAEIPDAVKSTNSLLNFTPGSNESELCFSWATKSFHIPSVQIVKTESGDTSLFTGESTEAFYNSDDRTINAGWFQNKVTVNGLKPSTFYKYRVGFDTIRSDFHQFQTCETSVFNFLVMGDPQIGSQTNDTIGPPEQANNVFRFDSIGWRNTITKASQIFPNTSFLISLGDQIESSSLLSEVDRQYDTYFRPEEFLNIPTATIDGTHDSYYGCYYGFHFNNPNRSETDGVIYPNDGDYWYTYGNALFMVINSNVQNGAPHDDFIGKALSANPDKKWKILFFHNSIYSCANHALSNDILYRRAQYVPIIDKYAVDVVIMGHDHSYCRTFQMLGNTPVSGDSDGFATVNPKGTLYLTLNSSSGSKYYPLNRAFLKNGQLALPSFVKVYRQHYRPTFSNIKISADTFSIVSYVINNENHTIPFDSCAVVRTTPRPIVVTTAKKLKAILFRRYLHIEGTLKDAGLKLFDLSGVEIIDFGKNTINESKNIPLSGHLKVNLYILKIISPLHHITFPLIVR